MQVSLNYLFAKFLLGIVTGLPRQAFFCGDLAIVIAELPVKAACGRKQKKAKTDN